MSKGRDLFEYCVEHPQMMYKLQDMKKHEIAEYTKTQGFDLSENDIRDFMEICAESNDEQLASVVSGGSCSGHCGRSCEADAYDPNEPWK